MVGLGEQGPFHPAEVPGNPDRPVRSPGQLLLHASYTPHPDLPVPPPGGAQWESWSRAVLDEARASLGVESRRRWMVVHPGNEQMETLLSRIREGRFDLRAVERPEVLCWISAYDGRAYTLIEFLRLARQADVALPVALETECAAK